jgi:hypothetical protein
MSFPDSDHELDVRELVTIRGYRDLHEALLAKGRLESSGVDTFLADENIVRMDWLISTAIGGVKLRVDAANVEAANEILDHPAPQSFEDSLEYELPTAHILPFRKPKTFPL